MQGDHQVRWSPCTLRQFSAHTRIQTSRTTSTAHSALHVGNVVLGRDARADKGRGALAPPSRVTRLHRKSTMDWIRLRWFVGTAREVPPPGHNFLDALGGFPKIEEQA